LEEGIRKLGEKIQQQQRLLQQQQRESDAGQHMQARAAASADSASSRFQILHALHNSYIIL
jgi:hypothetical protein